MFTSSLRFTCAARADLSTIRAIGLPNDVELCDTYEEALRVCTDCILAIDAFAANGHANQGVGEAADDTQVPADLIVNVDPYVPPTPVTAAGGFVFRGHGDGLELLLIYRRGVWDLPKGKQDADESIEECARREVREELGVDDVRITRGLGTTVHGYPHKGRYAVKTTHWFAMTTSATSFRPERKEQIEAVEWVPIGEAGNRLGFETLRRHLDAVRRVIG